MARRWSCSGHGHVQRRHAVVGHDAGWLALSLFGVWGAGRATARVPGQVWVGSAVAAGSSSALCGVPSTASVQPKHRPLSATRGARPLACGVSTAICRWHRAAGFARCIVAHCIGDFPDHGHSFRVQRPVKEPDVVRSSANWASYSMFDKQAAHLLIYSAAMNVAIPSFHRIIDAGGHAHPDKVRRCAVHTGLIACEFEHTAPSG
jgi:hypothetical protein